MKIYYTAVPTNSKEFLSRILRDFYGISTPKITKNSYGKPYFIDFSLFFSISHSENITAIALSKREIGLDIQKKRAKTPKRVTQRLSVAEKQEDFYRIWTTKEAYIKYCGKSIAKLYSRLEYKNGALYEQNTPVAAVFFYAEIEGCTLCVCSAEQAAAELINID